MNDERDNESEEKAQSTKRSCNFELQLIYEPIHEEDDNTRDLFFRNFVKRYLQRLDAGTLNDVED